jgi:predicted dehydrogenase
LRIGLLGAARIADEGIIGPAKTLGHQVAAVAARDRGRAEAFAARHGIPTVHDTYAHVIADVEAPLRAPEVDAAMRVSSRTARAPRHPSRAVAVSTGRGERPARR